MSDPDVLVPAPRDNPFLQGHDAAEHVLLDAFESGKLAHAWLITGPRGIGKATLAYRFARFVLAQGVETAKGGLFGDGIPAIRPDSLYMESDQPIFRRIAAGGHADFLAIERAIDDKGKRRSEIVVDDVRAIGAFFNLTAAEGGWRVVIIDSAEEMNRNAANAVLKALEEPPPNALLLLVSHNPGRLLPTVRSRCRRLPLKALDSTDVAALIARYSPQTAAADIAILTRLADGSIGRVIDLAEEGGLDLYQDVVGLLETLPSLDVKRLHALSERFGKPGAEDSFRTATDLLRWWLGRLVLFGAGADEGTGESAETALMRRLSSAAALDRWLEVWEKVNRLLARAAGGANLDRKQVFLNAFLAIEDAVRG